MTVERLVLGSMGANCYLIGNEERVLVIDPADEPEVIFQHIRNRKVDYILLTHSHVDHISALKALKAKYPEAKLGVHEAEVSYLSNPELNLSRFIGEPVVFSGAPELILSQGQTLPFLDQQIQVIHTPGHTPGGCCFLLGGNLFSGDTLFRMSIGRTDFPGGLLCGASGKHSGKDFYFASKNKSFSRSYGRNHCRSGKKRKSFFELKTLNKKRFCLLSQREENS